MQPGKSFSEEKRMEFKATYASKTDAKIAAASSVKEEGPLRFLIDIVPINIFASASDNSNMLQVIFFQIHQKY